jgi:pimeloyl-ACP methyl ester carboxylesterase
MRRCVILNAPHPRVFRRELLHPAQMLRSWYIGAFQLPWLPELFLRRNRCAWLAEMLRREAGPDAFSAEDLRAYATALARPGVLTAAIHYYRAVVRYGGAEIGNVPVVEVPTLLLWGDRDRYLGVRMSEIPKEWSPRLEVVHFPQATHWLEHDAAAAVNEHLIRFLHAEEPSASEPRFGG